MATKRAKNTGYAGGRVVKPAAKSRTAPAKPEPKPAAVTVRDWGLSSLAWIHFRRYRTY